jgi:hypothetical protein
VACGYVGNRGRKRLLLDRSGCTVANCRALSEDLAAFVVREGARAFVHYSDDCVDQEARAIGSESMLTAARRPAE